MAFFELDITGLEGVLERIEGVRQRADDISPIAIDIGEAFQGDVDERFNTSPGIRETGTVYGGVTWPSLTDAYIAQAIAANPKREGGQQLRDTGELLQSFTLDDPKGNNVFEYGADFVTFGSSLPQARGLHRKRPIVVIHDDLVEVISNILSEWVIDGTVGGR